MFGVNLAQSYALNVIPHFNCLMPELFWVCATMRDYTDLPENM